MKRREAKGKGEKERYTHLNVEFQRIARRDKKSFLSDQCKEIEENSRVERLDLSSRKLEIVQVQCMRQGARGWCTGMTQRDGMGNTCKSMADSFQCVTKPTTIL